MTKAEKRKLAELSLIYGVPIVTQARENSRLAGLQRKLQKLIMPDLMTLPNMGTEEAAYVDEHIDVRAHRTEEPGLGPERRHARAQDLGPLLLQAVRSALLRLFARLDAGRQAAARRGQEDQGVVHQGRKRRGWPG